MSEQPPLTTCCVSYENDYLYICIFNYDVCKVVTQQAITPAIYYYTRDAQYTLIGWALYIYYIPPFLVYKS